MTDRRQSPLRGALRLPALLFALLLMSAPAWAHSVKTGDIMIGHTWAYPSKTGNSSYAGALNSYIDVYMPILNNGAADALTGVSSPAAQKIELAQPTEGHFIFLAPNIDLPSGKPVTLSPMGAFFRLSGLTRNFRSGDKFPITLSFRHTPAATIDVIVENHKSH